MGSSAPPDEALPEPQSNAQPVTFGGADAGPDAALPCACPPVLPACVACDQVGGGAGRWRDGVWMDFYDPDLFAFWYRSVGEPRVTVCFVAADERVAVPLGASGD